MKNIYRVSRNGFYKYIGIRGKTISARIPSMIYDIIMEYEGKTFTDKLVNLVFDYKEFHDLKKCNTKILKHKCNTW